MLDRDAFWMDLLMGLSEVHSTAHVPPRPALARLAAEHVPAGWSLRATRAAGSLSSRPLDVVAIGELSVAADRSSSPALSALVEALSGSLSRSALLLDSLLGVPVVVSRLVHLVSGCAPHCPAHPFTLELLAAAAAGDCAPVDALSSGLALCWGFSDHGAAALLPEYRSLLSGAARAGVARELFWSLREAGRVLVRVGRSAPAGRVEVFSSLVLDGLESRRAWDLSAALV